MTRSIQARRAWSGAARAALAGLHVRSGAALRAPLRALGRESRRHLDVRPGLLKASQVIALAAMLAARGPKVLAAGQQAAATAFGSIGHRAIGLPAATRRVLNTRLAAASRIRLASIAAVATPIVAGVTLFLCYLHVSRSAPVTSDGASNALQAWDMLHHNLLLRGWRLSDVSFYTTELPEYMLIERIRGLSPDVVHIAAALTYTMLVLLAALLAKGRATGRAAMSSCLVAVGIMLAPQAGTGVSVLIGAPDHTGSAVPVLAAFALVDRARRRWYLPVVTGLMLAWALVGDGIVLYTGVLPMIAVNLARAYQIRFRLRQRWRRTWPELALAATAVAAVLMAARALALIGASGGFAIWPLPKTLASASGLPHYLTITWRGLLLLFGADFLGHGAGFVSGLAGLHLIGLSLAAWGTCAAIRRFGRSEPAVQLLAATIAITLAAFAFGTRAADLPSVRDIAIVLPCGAALAGRLLAGRLAEARLLPALALAGVGYLISLGRVVTLPAVPPQDAALAEWLDAHHLTCGLAGYWDANITTLDAAGRIRLRSALADGLRVTADYWEVKTAWYLPTANEATFMVLVPGPPGFTRYPTIAAVRHTFGQPARIYYLGSYTIVVWNKNLLDSLATGRPRPARKPDLTTPAAPLPAPPDR